MNIEHRSDVSPSLGVSVDFFDSNLLELQKTYAGMWIALAGRTVRLAKREADELHKEIIAKCPSETLLIEYVPLPSEEPLDWK